MLTSCFFLLEACAKESILFFENLFMEAKKKFLEARR